MCTKEEQLLTGFKRCYKSKNPKQNIKIGTGNQSKIADCELEYNNKYVKLEAKVFNDTRSNSNNIHKMFTQILTNRNKSCHNNQNNLDVEYGFLFDISNVTYVKGKLKKEFINDDLITFGKSFNLEYVFIYDSKKNSFQIESWTEFIK
ncbi:MAG: hypothetical protein KIB00_16850 [Paeniclostridium sordellii]|nr:hypothetical protein [Paeniclostridium sordellii]